MEQHQALFTDLLIALLDLAQNDQAAQAGALAARVDARPLDVAEALVSLERRGLVDAGRARLTFGGLAVAAALRARRAEAHGRCAA
jgi:Mn-dependent DtxR family transcriptional regulator